VDDSTETLNLLATDGVLAPIALSSSHAVACDLVQGYLQTARARNTIRGYRSSFRQFEAWCKSSGFAPLPAAPETIAQYIAIQASRLCVSTIEHHLAAIKKAHVAAGFSLDMQTSLLLTETLKGVKRVHGSAVTQKTAILTEDCV
jgi:hypothetical protein